MWTGGHQYLGKAEDFFSFLSFFLTVVSYPMFWRSRLRALQMVPYDCVLIHDCGSINSIWVSLPQSNFRSLTASKAEW